MQTEILMIGTELLIGQIVDTNASYMGQVLAENGINLFQKTTVGDNPARIRTAMDDAMRRSGIVLTSGGLGPTEDDLTRECIAELLDRPLELRQDLLDMLTERFKNFRAPMTENNKKQALVPRGATPIENPHGTAPGLIVEDPRGTIICMPGVPWELKPMLSERVIPYLRQRFGVQGVLRSRVLKVCAIGESRVDTAMGDLMATLSNPTIGVLASPDAVRIRLTAKAPTIEEADALLDPLDAQIRNRLPGLVMGVDDETLEGVVDALLTQKGWTLAVAESFTGGTLAQRLTQANARMFAGSHVAPLSPAWGNPRQMAETVQAAFHADCALGIGVTPDGETVQTVCLTPEGVHEWTLASPKTDNLSQIRAAVASLERLRRVLIGQT